MRRSCTHSMHALLSTVPAWLFFVSRLFQGPDGSDTHLIESASCTRIALSSWRAGQLVVYFVPACRFIGCSPNAERRLETYLSQQKVLTFQHCSGLSCRP